MLAFIADVHGNYPALKAVIDEIHAQGCEKIFSLGDVAGYYCMINECADLLRRHNITNIMGNHDYYITHGTGCPRSTSANDCLAYQEKIILPEHLDWLRASPRQLLYEDINMVHGGWYDTLDEYMVNIPSDYFSPFEGNFFMSGHTHTQCLRTFQDKQYCNPGSVGQPRDGNPQAAYALLENGVIHLKRTPYDIDVIANKMKEAGFSEYYYENLYQGAAIGGRIFTA